MSEVVAPKSRFVEQGFYKGRGMAVFTSGGDSQGMNAALRAVVRMGIYLGCKVYFIREGYQGMVDGGAYIEEAHWLSVSFIFHKGGTIIGTARCSEFREREGRLKAAKNLIKKGINNLVVIGGDGSLTGANLFKNEWSSLVDELQKSNLITGEEAMKYNFLNIVGIVGSIDNDFTGTDMTIGTDSALHRIIEAIDAIVSTAYSHKRTFILEIMGRNCGYLALAAALASEADYVFIPESPPSEDWPKELCTKLLQERASGSRLNIILVSEGAIDRNGEAISVEKVRKVVVENLKQDAKVTVLGHIQRGGNPSAFDRVLGSRMGAEAVIALMDSKPDQEALVISLEGNQVIRLPLMNCVETTQAVGEAVAAKDWENAIKLRGMTFTRNLGTYHMLKGVYTPASLSSVRYKYGVLHIGAPACGMNAAIFSFVRTSIFNGDVVYGIHDGIEGFCAGNLQRMQWADVTSLVGRGGVILGTKRTLPEGKFDKIAARLKEYNIQGLLIIGGFEAYRAGLQFMENRDKYPEFRIPLLVIPSTISNNVPGTEFSLGCDTAVNEIIQICDRIRQSAEGTKRRVFIIETMGGYCGYLATLSALAGGADAAYIFEEKFSIKDLEKDVYHLSSKMAEGIQRGLIIRNEKCNENYNAEFMYRLCAEEGKGLFSARMNILGHMQQGGTTSPFDRGFGIKLGGKASTWFGKVLQEMGMVNSETMPQIDGNDYACLLGLRKRNYVYSPLEKLKEETNFQHRIPKNQWWLKLRPLLRIFAKHESVYEEEGEYIEVDERQII